MIKLAALRHKVTGEIYTGKCHAYCHVKVPIKTHYKEFEDGFITDNGEFLNRFEAGEHAIKCGQIEKMKYSYGLDSQEVCAKDITKDDVDEFNWLRERREKEC